VCAFGKKQEKRNGPAIRDSFINGEQFWDATFGAEADAYNPFEAVYYYFFSIYQTHFGMGGQNLLEARNRVVGLARVLTGR